MLKKWKGPKISRKLLIALKTNKLSKKVQVLPCFLGLYFNKKKVSMKLLGLKLGEFFLTRRKIWHKK
jgi:ribosomal protein S19